MKNPSLNIQEYNFTGQIYIPNQTKIITGNFTHDGSSAFKGKMYSDGESRDTIEGILLNNQTFNVPGSENNPKNILIFAYFSQSLPNQWFYLTKSGTDFEGKYNGRSEAQKNIASKIKGVDTWRCIEMTRYLDMHLQDKNLDEVQIDILKKRD